MKTQEEIENEMDVLGELVDHFDNLKEKEHRQVGVRTITNVHHSRCPRCQSVMSISSGHSHCMDCNWDSLDELRLHTDKWSA